MDDLSRIIENTYSAATDPAAWPVVVDSLQAYFRCSSVGLYNADLRRGTVSLVHVRDIDPAYVRVYVRHYLRNNPWTRVPALQAQGRIRTDRSLDEHYNDPGYYRRTAYYNEFMKPQGFVYTLGVNLYADNTVLSKLYLYRPRRRGPFARAEAAAFERLTRHLVRAVDVSRRLAGDELNGSQALRVFDELNFGVLFVDEDGCVTEANDFGRGLLVERDGISDAQGTLTASYREDSVQLARAVSLALDLRRGFEAVEAPKTVRLGRPSGKAPLRVTAVPLPARSNHPFSANRAAVALIIVDPELDLAIASEALRRRHELTAAEARLVQSLARGLSLREAASRSGVRYETARGYLKSVFQKTGASRQTDLLRLLLSDGDVRGGRAARERTDVTD